MSTRWQWYCIGLLSLAAGLWFLYKPVVSIAHLIETGQLPTMMIRRPFPGRWFETTVEPFSFDGCKSWLAYSFLSLPGVVLLAFAVQIFFKKFDVRNLFTLFQIWFYVSCMALVILIFYEFIR